MSLRFKQNSMLIKLLLASEALFFVALIIGFVFFRNTTDNWNEYAKYVNVKRTSIFSLFLFSSSGTITLANRALKKNQRNTLIYSLSFTILLGAIFLFGQLTEYLDLFQKQVNINENIFGSVFFTLTGFHGFHVFIGLIILSIFLGLYLNGNYKIEAPSSFFLVTEWYWHFVDLVWVFVFFIVYLMPIL